MFIVIKRTMTTSMIALVQGLILAKIVRLFSLSSVIRSRSGMWPDLPGHGFYFSSVGQQQHVSCLIRPQRPIVGWPSEAQMRSMVSLLT